MMCCQDCMCDPCQCRPLNARRSKNIRKRERRDAVLREPEPKPDPVTELADIVGELIGLIESMTIDQPSYHRPLEKIKERVNELRGW